MKTDIHLEKVPLDGSDLAPRVKAACQKQAARDNPRRLTSTFVLQTAANQNTLFLVFELFDQQDGD